jgi:hypothetical protein
MRVKPVLLALGITLSSINVWTGAPLAALWIGSRVQGDDGGASMTAVFVVIVVLGALALGLVALVSRMSAAYDAALGRLPARRRQTTWLKPMAAERRDFEERRRDIRPAERILVAVVACAVVLFEAWFFFLSGSSLANA